MLRATFVFAFLVTSLSIPLTAQGPIVIDENDRVILRGYVPPLARPQYDIGRTNPNLRMQRMTLVLAPSTREPRDWRRQQNVGSRIGSSDKQLQAVTSWLQSQGFAIEHSDVGPFSVSFGGTVAHVEKAFGVEIHNYQVDGKTYHANANYPSIPRALSGSIGAVNSLSDLPMASGNSASETILRNFTGTLYDPASGGIMDSAGNLYGTTPGGGSAGLGTVFKINTAGNETVLYNFTGAANGDGANPSPGLVMDSAGNLYGTTTNGGAAGLCTGYDYGCGTVFKLDTSDQETVLHSFTYTNGDGTYPYAGLIMDGAGNLYGTTSDGGSDGRGTVFKLDSTGNETILYSFGTVGGLADGLYPYAGLIMDSSGNLYGTTSGGGNQGSPSCYGWNGTCGTVFKVDSAGNETVLYSFTGTNGDGSNPYAGLILDSAGNLYGTTVYSGNTGGPCNTLGCGTVFKLDTTGLETVLHSFTGANGDGENPQTALIMDSEGNLYGTASGYPANGGSIPPSGGEGIVFKLNTSNQETVLYTFTGASGANPNSSLILDTAGNFYGTTMHGGSASGGTFFKLGTTGNETVLYSFPATNGDGAAPAAGLIMDGAGNLYGTTGGGGKACAGPFGGNYATGCGTVFKLDPTGNETVIYSFTGTNGDGANPQAPLTMDSAGNLYGTSFFGGSQGEGTVFKLDTTGQETVLFSFTGGNGAWPSAGLVMDSAGNLYGTTLAVYPTANPTPGIVFKLDTTGHETLLYSFTGENGDGANPYAGLIIDSAGNLYGTTVGGGTNPCPVTNFVPGFGYSAGCGTVFKVNPTGQETVLYKFTGTNGDGAYPAASLTMDSAGNLYGTTFEGGTGTCPFGGCGTVFKLDPKGNETVLYSFTGTNGDQNPFAPLIMDSAGNLYGTTSAYYGGDSGTVFKLDPTGQETVLYAFNEFTNGARSPYGGVVMDSAGNLYGTAFLGGSARVGAVFELIPLLTPTVTVTPSSSSITTAQALSVTVAVAGGSGNPTPTGTVTLSSGGYTSAATTLTSGSATINIPAGSLAVGTDTLTASYSGDSNYSPANGTSSVTVTTAPPSFTVTGTAVSVSPGATTGNTSAITVTPSGGFTGSVTLTATITSSPTGAQDPPTLSFGSTSPVDITGASAGTGTLTISTTAATSGALAYPVRPGIRWYATGGAGLAFALVLGMGVPTRRRSWRARFGLLFFLVVLNAGLVACSSGGSGGGGGGGNPGTTAGTYTITVTGTSGNTTATGTITLTVQ